MASGSFHFLKLSALVAGTLVVSSCDSAYLADLAAADGAALSASEIVAEPSAESVSLSEYYENVESGLLVRGLLRTDGGGPDTPFTSRNLAENFVRLALFEEYKKENGRIYAQETASKLQRWESPIRMKIEFGASITKSQQALDRTNIEHFSSRLSRLAGLYIRQVSNDVNFHVFVANLGELRDLAPTMNQDALTEIEKKPRAASCLVSREINDTGALSRVVVVIRGELPEVLRLACIHEELTQGLGILNDSPRARPSIFNDDEEFALLTSHDEMLLRILYDRRMRVGMTAGEARVQAEIIAAELIGGES